MPNFLEESWSQEIQDLMAVEQVKSSFFPTKPKVYGRFHSLVENLNCKTAE